MSNPSIPQSITKEEINKLPQLQFEGKSSVVIDAEHAKVCIKELSEAKILGFDTETRPSFKKGEHYKTALLQLSTEKKAYLFRLNKIGFSDQLRDLMADPSIQKVGVAIHDDIKALQKLNNFEPGGFEELADYAKKAGVKNLGLRSLAAIFLDGRVSKGAKLTNWEGDVLTQPQIAYAATDAWVGLKIFLKFQSLNLVK
ncbi:MAG: 3'-5' exonuclease domain-containing protein 2 [Halobacteriovoraceae bacterium]|nr:3'-5' exonuclease domain-containing protein 2 [Halobacteriovoraceae bacterium]MBT5095479.1 3'-5' exonuclease domain-containing protein 2 [Halobacteriovoraceae bacterium]